uniref:tRNA pseudouridine synthase Pus10 isoform X2 n=1 Tax=Myxine glutinosa TaxID=7769 RepID=UPI00358FEB73
MFCVLPLHDASVRPRRFPVVPPAGPCESRAVHDYFSLVFVLSEELLRDLKLLDGSKAEGKRSSDNAVMPSSKKAKMDSDMPTLDHTTERSSIDNGSELVLEQDARREEEDTRERVNSVDEERACQDTLDEASPFSAVCTVCLGIMQQFCEASFIEELGNEVKKSGFEFGSVVVSVSFPVQLAVREHAACLILKEACRAEDPHSWKSDAVSLKEAYKWVVYEGLSEWLGVPVEGKSPFEVTVNFTHEETKEECHFLASLFPGCFKPAKNKQSVFTRMAVSKALAKIGEDQFRSHSSCPPKPTSLPCRAQKISCSHGPVYVAGRYNKFSRSLPQTPWIIDGERRMDSSVEELISEPLKQAFAADGFNLSSSGREDVDVRTLGRGRPFAVELLNPRRTATGSQMVHKMQLINGSSNKIAVRDLQVVTRDSLWLMKQGEEEKTKLYSALVWSERELHQKDLEMLNNIKELRLDQKTPLRVLHRRPLAVRPRVVHTIHADLVNAHQLRLQLHTQAGTYIKEFVHGDFGRTQPNLRTLLNTYTDILELDVESVDVDWPPPVNDTPATEVTP